MREYTAAVIYTYLYTN